MKETPAVVIVSLPDGRVLRFSDSFHIGRDAGCEVAVSGSQVSRRHAEVSRVQGAWVVRDLQSSNGLFVDGQRVEIAPVGDGVTVALGADGPRLDIAPEAVPKAAAPTPAEEPATRASVDEYAQRYFGSDDDESVGGRTLMIRKAFQQVQGRQKRQQRLMIATVALLGLSAAGYAIYEHRLLGQEEQKAEALFYQLKSLDVLIAQRPTTGNVPDAQEAAYIAQQREIERNYVAFAAQLYDRRLNETDRLILKVTRTFGECELAAPPEYMREVKRYIGKWQQTGRFARDVKTAQDRGYIPQIVTAFMARGLPPEYFYLGMQESDFDPFISGPPTRWGVAKGMWQFIPETAAKYGLRIGPRAGAPGVDLADERMNWQKATGAAASYVKYIYATDAQASGLLVIASYNWGEHRVIDLLRTMPSNPRDRNFWQLLAKHRDQVPLQTYDYVFNIVSAAVIGENPRLFGFDFDSPLKFVNPR